MSHLTNSNIFDPQSFSLIFVTCGKTERGKIGRPSPHGSFQLLTIESFQIASQKCEYI